MKCLTINRNAPGYTLKVQTRHALEDRGFTSCPLFPSAWRESAENSEPRLLIDFVGTEEKQEAAIITIGKAAFMPKHLAPIDFLNYRPLGKGVGKGVCWKIIDQKRIELTSNVAANALKVVDVALTLWDEVNA